MHSYKHAPFELLLCTDTQTKYLHIWKRLQYSVSIRLFVKLFGVTSQYSLLCPSQFNHFCFPLNLYTNDLYFSFLKAFPWFFNDFLNSIGTPNEAHVFEDSKLAPTNERKHATFVFLVLADLRAMISHTEYRSNRV